MEKLKRNMMYNSTKLIGAYISIEQASHLSLNALFHNITISDLLRSLLTDFLEKGHDKEYLINSLAKQTYNEWMQWYETNRYNTGWRSHAQIVDRYTEFKSEVLCRLYARKIYDGTALKIIEKMDAIKDGE